MSTPTIPDGRPYFNANLYTGSGSSQTVTTTTQLANGALVWTKNRSGTNFNWDTRSTGMTNNYSFLQSSTTNAENTGANNYTMTFNNGSYVLGSGDNINISGNTFVGYTWALGTAASNTSGSITSSVQVNATAGVSVITFTGGSGNQTVGHGLGVAPSMVILKRRDSTSAWLTYHSSLSSPATSFLSLNTTSAVTSASPFWGASGMTSTTIGTSDNATINGATYVAYCWAPIAGYSAFGSYTGNNSADGPFVYLGFRPRWILFKDSSNVTNWVLQDTSRFTYNLVTGGLLPNTSASEYSSGYDVDILSNGFKIRRSGGDTNQSSANIIYAAFAENPFKYSNAR
jgi:hypothetical protein